MKRYVRTTESQLGGALEYFESAAARFAARSSQGTPDERTTTSVIGRPRESKRTNTTVGRRGNLIPNARGRSIFGRATAVNVACAGHFFAQAVEGSGALEITSNSSMATNRLIEMGITERERARTPLWRVFDLQNGTRCRAAPVLIKTKHPSRLPSI